MENKEQKGNTYQKQHRFKIKKKTFVLFISLYKTLLSPNSIRDGAKTEKKPAKKKSAEDSGGEEAEDGGRCHGGRRQ